MRIRFGGEERQQFPHVSLARRTEEWADNIGGQLIDIGVKPIGHQMEPRMRDNGFG